MNKKVVLTIFLLVVLVIIGGLYLNAEKGDNVMDPNTNRKVILISPEPGSEVSSPLRVEGRAPGNWFFEANIPIEIRTHNGQVLGRIGAQAQEVWMTEDLVLFEGVLNFSVPAGVDGGLIVIEKDNPSGLPENAGSQSFEIKFSEELEETSFSVYFQHGESVEDGDCSSVVPVTRTVTKTQAVGDAAIHSLLEGPTEREAMVSGVGEFASGLVSNIPENVSLNSLQVEEGVAYVDFSDEVNDAAGSCRVTAIRAQIEETLKQFSTVDEVVISVNGDVDTALQP